MYASESIVSRLKQHNVIFNEDKRSGLQAVEKQQATWRRPGMDEVWYMERNYTPSMLGSEVLD